MTPSRSMPGLGEFIRGRGGEREFFTLYVDARFDFGEVLAWLMAHGEEVEVSE